MTEGFYKHDLKDNSNHEYVRFLEMVSNKIMVIKVCGNKQTTKLGL